MNILFSRNEMIERRSDRSWRWVLTMITSRPVINSSRSQVFRLDFTVQRTCRFALLTRRQMMSQKAVSTLNNQRGKPSKTSATKNSHLAWYGTFFAAAKAFHSGESQVVFVALIIRDRSFPWTLEFLAEPRNLPISAEFLCLPCRSSAEFTTG